MDRINKIMPYAFPVIIVFVGTFYYFVNPSMESYPVQCIWRVLTNTQCPSCGMQRALYALLHGNFLQALNYNYYFIFSIPYALSAIIATWYNYKHKLDWLRNFVYHRRTLQTYAYSYFLWWVARNLLNI